MCIVKSHFAGLVGPLILSLYSTNVFGKMIFFDFLWAQEFSRAPGCGYKPNRVFLIPGTRNIAIDFQRRLILCEHQPAIIFVSLNKSGHIQIVYGDTVKRKIKTIILRGRELFYKCVSLSVEFNQNRKFFA